MGNLEKLNLTKTRLVAELKPYTFEKVTGELKAIIKKNNLDATPIIARDLFEYVITDCLLDKI